MKIFALFIAASAFVFASSGIEASRTTITAADAGRPVALRIGQELALNLESNPSTGYRWFLASTENSVLTSLGKPSYRQGRPVPGAGGIESWTFRAAQAGAQTLKFEYRRPWEKETPPAKTVFFHVTVLELANAPRTQTKLPPWRVIPRRCSLLELAVDFSK